jgi:RNA polymerase sigma factor (sigma-70 family)
MNGRVDTGSSTTRGGTVSTPQPSHGPARQRIAIGAPLLRLHSDEQLVALFRAGHDEAFRAIHDRYEKRLRAYTRQMLPGGHDDEDAVQDVFIRAYSGLRSSQREFALRAWLFRVAHNRCVDELRRPKPPAPEVLQLTGHPVQDPVSEADRRESLRRLIVDVRRLSDQQRSALLMREMGGISYAELACRLGTSVPAVKSLLVRARIALAEAAAARDTACSVIRDELVGAHDCAVRPNATAQRHMRDCPGCRNLMRELRTKNRRPTANTGSAIGRSNPLAA